MQTKKQPKTFDAVNMMRKIREQISSETQNMTFDELKKYIQGRIKDSNFKTIGQ